MSGTAAKACETPTARQRRVWDKAAPGYNKQIAFFGGSGSAAAASGSGPGARPSPEIAVGTGRNLEHYNDQVTVTGVDLSPECSPWPGVRRRTRP